MLELHYPFQCAAMQYNQVVIRKDRLVRMKNYLLDVYQRIGHPMVTRARAGPHLACSFHAEVPPGNKASRLVSESIVRDHADSHYF